VSGDSARETAAESLVIHNATVITPQEVLQPGVVVVERGRIGAVYAGEPPPGGSRLDAGGSFVAPGFVDMHVHGGNGADFMDGTPEAFDTICRFYARHGVTALQATTVAAPLEDILRVLHTARGWKESQPPDYPGARLLGVHVEGPFLAVEQKGAHRADAVRRPSPAELARLLEYADVIGEVTLAPELPGALQAIRELSGRGILVAAGHSQARERDVLAAVEAGLRHVTHIYSAMSTVIRQGPWRVPGLLEMALTSDALSTEMIGDGKHLPPTLMKLVLKCKLPDRVCLVSDAMSGAGMPEGGTFWLAGQQVIVEDGVAMLSDHTAFASSIMPLDGMVGNMVRLMGMPVEEAVRLATLNPARVLGITDRKGSIAPGMDADLVLFDDAIRVQATMIAGTLVSSSLPVHPRHQVGH
jgi:N-acetylglucosamine-6-phosphate deacetylase